VPFAFRFKDSEAGARWLGKATRGGGQFARSRQVVSRRDRIVCFDTFAESDFMRNVSRDEAIRMGLKPETWDCVQMLPKSHFKRLALARAVTILRRVTQLEKKHGPIRLG
jgi:hypothetical protein